MAVLEYKNTKVIRAADFEARYTTPERLDFALTQANGDAGGSERTLLQITQSS